MGRKVWNSTAGWLYEVPLLRTSRSVTIEDIDERISLAEQQLFQKRKKEGADVQEEILVSCSDDEPEPKKRAKQASSEAKDAAKAAAAEMRKSLAETARHNKVTQALATRVVLSWLRSQWRSPRKLTSSSTNVWLSSRQLWHMTCSRACKTWLVSWISLRRL